MNRSSISLGWRLVTPIMLLLFARESPADVLTDHDNGPLTGIFGFPDSTEGSEIMGRGQHGWDSSLIIASHNIDEMRDVASFRLDGETSRLAFTYRYGISGRFEFGIEAPYVWHRSGFLDSMIDGWHDFFGLPDGPRATRERDRLAIFYADSQTVLVDANSNVSGIGDIRSAVYDSETESLGAASVSLTFGTDFHLSDRYRLVLSVGEDVRPDSAPDVSFQIALRYGGRN